MAETPEPTPRKLDEPFHAAGAGDVEPRKDSPFKFLPASTHIPEDRVTAVLLVPFMPDGRILAVQHAKRGFDIPGGRKELTDKTDFETARRELLEESGALIGQIRPCVIMQTEPYSRSGAPQSDEPSYMIVMTGVVQELGHFSPNNEIVGRHLLSPEIFLQSYGGEYEGDMAFIIQTAQQTLAHERGEAPNFNTMN